jgi:predicted LPLAT superfamily acyltransferase
MAAAMNSSHWAGRNEISFVAGMRLLFWICRVFGRWPFRIVLYPVLAWYVMAKPLPRRASLDYLRRASAFAPVPTGLRGVMRHFGAFAETILDKMQLWGGIFDAPVTFHGIAQMQALIDAKQGALIMCSHLGNVELCRVMSQAHPGLKLTVLVYTRHARAFNEMMASIDPRSGLDLLQVTDMTPATAIMLSERVAEGQFVVIAGDRVPVAARPRCVQAPFLGSDAPFPVGPYVLASVLQCPIYLMFSARTGTGFDVHFEHLCDSVRLARKDRDGQLARLALAYAARLQHYCLRTPLEWFNFYDFWQQPNPDPIHAP